MVVVQQNVVVGRQQVFRPYRLMDLGKRSNSVQSDKKLVDAMRSYSIAYMELEKLRLRRILDYLRTEYLRRLLLNLSGWRYER